MEEVNSTREHLKEVILLLIGFIIGFGTHAFTAGDRAEPESTDLTMVSEVTENDVSTASTSSAPEEPVVEPVDATIHNNAAKEGYSLSVTDQAAGATVYVSQAVTPEDVWIAVREDMNGSLGNILGAARFPAGTNSGTVELLRGTEAGSSYFGVIYIDNGDTRFDHTTDTLLSDETNGPIGVKFRVY